MIAALAAPPFPSEPSLRIAPVRPPARAVARSAAVPPKPDPGAEKQIRELKATDREVRAHEAAHQAAAGQYGGGATFTYSVGPDGQSYATGGEVQIDVSPVAGDPRATVEKMEIVQRAALAPADPSGQDRSVAAYAQQAAAAARQEIAESEGSEPARASAAASAEHEPDRSGVEPGAPSFADRAVATPRLEETVGSLLDLVA